MRISDWSSDVCSSDLRANSRDHALPDCCWWRWPFFSSLSLWQRLGASDDDVGAEKTNQRYRHGFGGGRNACARLRGGSALSDVLPGNGVRSEEHTSELQSLMRISYAVFCLKKKNKQ